MGITGREDTAGKNAESRPCAEANHQGNVKEESACVVGREGFVSDGG
jgi:hypothetical protein